MTTMRVDRVRISHSSAGREQDRPPGVAVLDDPSVDELDRADVDAPRRLLDDEQRGLVGELAGDEDLLQVAAGQLADGWSGPDTWMSYVRTSSVGVLARRPCGAAIRGAGSGASTGSP